MSPLGLYVHIPFCGSICHYCNFNRGLFDGALKDRYLCALENEIAEVGAKVAAGRHPVTGRPLNRVSERRKVRGPEGQTDSGTLGLSDLRISVGRAAADTIYFGGGTPSLLAPVEIARVLEACRTAFAVADDSEVTLEANPETVTTDLAAGYREAGVNRISMGVQSFRDEELRRLGRVHDAARARAALASVRAAGIENVSLDLMLWLPQQTVDDCLTSVRELARLGPSHASLYLLELYPNAPLKEEMARAGWSLAPDEDAAEMYLRAIDELTAAGYEHYEISNFARPGRASRHNLKYWTDQEWLAFGCGAHSTMDGVRWKNVSATDTYVAAIEAARMPGPVDGRLPAEADAAGEPAKAGIAEVRELTVHQRFQEMVFMGLRLVVGIDVDTVARRYGIDVWARYGPRLERFVEAGLLVRDGGRLRLTPRGLLLSNEIMSVFVDEDDRVR